MNAVLTQLKRLGPVLTKNIGLLVVGALVFATAILSIQFLTYEPTGMVVNDGWALSDDSVALNLRSMASGGEPAENILPVRIDSGDQIFTRLDGMYVGPKHTYVYTTYPFFINEGSAVEDTSGESKLITPDLATVDSYPGLILSDGAVFEPNGTRSDEAEYRFMRLGNGLYINTKPLVIAGGVTSGTIPVNSIIHFSENTLDCYMLSDGKFISRAVQTGSPSTLISLSEAPEETYSYREFLEKLGILSKPAEKVPAVEAAEPEKSAEETSTPTPKEAEKTSSDPGVWVWQKPTASSSQLTPSVYAASGSLSISDPAGVTTKPIRYEFWQGDQLFMRSSFSSSGSFTVNGLAPNGTYQVKAYITYKLKDGKTIVEDNFFNQTITMGSTSSLSPMNFTYQQGALAFDRLHMEGLTFTGGSSEAFANSARIAFLIDGKEYALSSTQRAALAKGEAVSYTSPASFASNTSYTVALVAYDRFGNAQQLNAPLLTMSTSKAPPTAILHLGGNDPTDIRIGVTIKDPDGVARGSARVELTDLLGNVLASQPITGDSSSYSFSTPGYDIALIARVVSDYDLKDGGGIHKEAVIGSMSFSTVPISSLGYAMFAADVKNLRDSAADLYFSMDINQMDGRLTALLSDVQVTVKSIDGAVVFDKALTPAQVEKLKTGEAVLLPLESLASMTQYRISVSAGVRLADRPVGTNFYSVRTSLRNSQFTTMRQTPIPQFKDFLVTKDLIGFTARVIDPDGAIGRNAMIEVRDPNNRLVGEQRYFDPVASSDGEYTRFLFDNLNNNTVYTVNLVAFEYNPGYDSTTLVGRQVLNTFTLTTEDGIDGKMELRGLDTVPDDSTHLSARLRVTLADRWQEISPKTFYVDVYKNNTKIDTIQYPFTGTGQTIDLSPYKVDKGKYTYRFDLRIIAHDQELVLDSASFSSERQIIGISNEQELKSIANDMSASYIALNDITTTTTYIGGTAAGIYFKGSLDFQGYKLTQRSSAALFYRASSTAVIKNIVLETIAGSGGAAGLVYSNDGTISNVRVDVVGLANTLTYASYGGIAYTNSATSVIENFVVKLSVPVKVSSYAGGACYSTNGIVRNGYVYGEGFIIPDELPSDTGINYVGGAVGYASGRSQVSNVFVDMDLTLPSDRVANYTGLVVGRSTNAVQGLLGVGTINNAQPSTGGPALGLISTSAQARDVYYYPETLECLNAYNKPAQPDALYDRQWYEQTITKGGSFNLTPILGECFPQVKWPSCMPQQELLPLPARRPAIDPTITSLSVSETGDDYAIATISVYNPSRYKITGFNVEYLRCQVISQVEDEEHVSRVTIRLSNPQFFYSNYAVLSLSYELYAGRATTVACSASLPVELFRPVATIEQWKAIDSSPYENYRLAQDIDFFGYGENQIYIVNGFRGKLNGNGYAVRNMKIVSDRGVFRSLYGSIYDLTVENLTVATTGVYSGFVGYAYAGAAIDNVHLKNPTITGTQYAGSLAAIAVGTTITNSSVSDASINTTYVLGRPVYVGSLVGASSTSTFTSCYAQDCTIVVEDAYASMGVGGLLGYAYSGSTITGCYALGEVTTTVPMLGGLIGHVGDSATIITDVWADVDITTPNDEVGGLFGTLDAAISQVGGLALGNIYVSSNGYWKVHNVVGGGALPDETFHYAQQHVDGGALDASTPLDYAQLCREDTYVGIIGFSSFEYDKVTEGVLPKVRATDGTLVPGQRDHYLAIGTIRVVDIQAEQVGGNYTVQLSVEHPAGYIIDALTFDWLDSDDPPVKSTVGTTKTIIQYPSVTPLRAYDTYRLMNIEYRDDTGASAVFKASAKIDFSKPIYKDIYTIDDWKAIPAATYENYRLMADLDFTGYTASQLGNCGMGIGRLEGMTKPDGSKVKIEDLDLTFPAANKLFIGTVRTAINNIQFENIKLTHAITNVSNNMGIIGTLYGSGTGGAQDLVFTNVTLTAQQNSSGTSMSYVGPIVQCRGLVSNVTAQDITVVVNSTKNTTNYFGGICAYIDSSGTLTSSSARDITINAAGGYAGGVVGGSAGPGVISNITAEHITVTTAANYAGGIVGSGGVVCDITARNMTVFGLQYTGGLVGSSSSASTMRLNATEVDVQGSSYVGGLCGNGSVSYSTVTGARVLGTGERIGGASGNSSGTTQYETTVTSSQVQGASSVGGVFGRSESYSISAMFVVDSTVEASGDYVGGIVGYSTHIYRSGNQGTQVTGASYVGGISGYSGYLYDLFVVPSVTGGSVQIHGSGDNVGGIAGENHYRGQNIYLYANADIDAGGVNAGGLIGNISTVYSTQVSNTTLARAYWVGSVHGSDNVGGLIGSAASGITTTDAGYVTSGSVSSDSGMNASFGVGKNLQTVSTLTQFGVFRIEKNSKLNGIPVTTGDAWSLLGAGSSNFAIATAADMNKTTFYSTTLGYSTTYWDITGAPAGVMPKIKWQGYSTLTGNLPYQTDVLTPSDEPSFAPFALMSKRTIPTIDTEKIDRALGDVKIYASGVDSINIEFGPLALALPDLTFAVTNGEKELLSGTLSAPVVTIKYDFVTPLDLTLSSQGVKRDHQIEPTELSRGVMTAGEQAYYITGDGISSLDGEVLSGSFVNLYQGSALSKNGEVFNIQGDTETAPVTTPAVLLETPCPLFTGLGDGGSFKTFHDFSVVGDNDLTATRPYRFYMKNATLCAVSSAMDIIPDAVVFDKVDNKEFQTFLTSNGTLEDLGDPLVYPEKFINEGIHYMSNNIASASKAVMIEYKSGSIVCFDYTTGKILLEEHSAGDSPSLFAFVANFFAKRLSVPPSVKTNPTYHQAKAFEAELATTGPLSATSRGNEEKGSGDGFPAGEPGSSHRSGGGFAPAATYVSIWEPSQGEYLTYVTSDLLNAAEAQPVSQNELADRHEAVSTVGASDGEGSRALGKTLQVILYALIVLGVAGSLVIVYRRQTRTAETSKRALQR